MNRTMTAATARREFLQTGIALAGKRDIGMRFGLIEAITTQIAPERAQRVLILDLLRPGGVVFDIGHGGGSFDYTAAEREIAQG